MVPDAPTLRGMEDLRTSLPPPVLPAFDNLAATLEELAAEGRLLPCEIPGALLGFAALLVEQHQQAMH